MKTNKDDLSLQRLKELVHYDPEIGMFMWLKSTGSRAIAGHHVGVCTPYDYARCCIDGKSYRLHRLAWFYVHGRWPINFIDHINGDRFDNRICNLREASCNENSQNRHAADSRNKSGLLGAHYFPTRNQWRARIALNGKTKHLGYFSSPEEAHRAYMKAKEIFHPFFGQSTNDPQNPQRSARTQVRATEETASRSCAG